MSPHPGGNAMARAALYFLALLAAAYTLHLAREMLLPLTLAIIFALLLAPLVNRMQAWRVPRTVSSLLLITGMLCVAGAGLTALSSSAMSWLQRVPEASDILLHHLERVETEVGRMDDAGDSLDALAREIAIDEGDASSQKVIIAPPGWRTELWIGMRNFAVFGGLSIILLFFLLSNGEALLRRCADAFPDTQDRRRALRIAHDAQLQMSRYLATVTTVNVVVGLFVGTALWLLDFPDPALWGTTAAVLRFVPYLGASLTLAMLAVVSVVSYESSWMMGAVPLGYLLFTSLVGQVVDPLVHGYRLRLDPIVVFVWIFFWGWIWGAPGVLLAVPLLTLLQVVCRHSTRLAPLAHIMGDR